MMFNRTRIQLTIRNAVVLGVILITLNVSVYWVMKGMLFTQIDRMLGGAPTVGVSQTLPGLSSSFAVKAQRVGDEDRLLFNLSQADRPTISLYWTKDMELIPEPNSQAFTSIQINRLAPDRLGFSPQTVKLDNQYFRVLKVEPAALAMTNGSGQTYVIAYQVLLRNISAEIGMLNRLAYILLFGGLVGLLVAVGAGYYLANRALVPIRESMERQQQFVSDASHELRTPLAVMQAHAELMLRHPDHTIEEDSQHVSTVLQEARRMSKLVGGLLTLARSDAGQLELDRKPVRLDRIVQDGVEKMKMLAEVKNLIIQTEIEAPVQLEADEDRLHQLLVIVLDNAIKYTPEGGLIRVVCRKLAHSAQLEVEDTGIGIAPDQLPRVFDRFYRSDKARTRQEGGTGLGLAIAQWIAERHGGKIRIESRLSIGTQVYISLPI